MLVKRLDELLCGIAGVLDKRGGDVVPILKGMLELIKHRGPDGFGFCANDMIQRVRTMEELDLSNCRSDRAIGHSRLAIVGGMSGIQPLQGCKKGLTILHNGEIYNHKKLRRELEHEHSFETFSDSEAIVHLLEEYYDGDLTVALAKTLTRLDGVFAIAALAGNELVIARDVMGVKQLYFSEGPRLIAFASEKKALWGIGFENTGKRLLPGHMAALGRDGIKMVQVLQPPLHQKTQYITDMEAAQRSYASSLRKAVSKRVEDQDKIGVIFSGGIDSVLIAKMVKDQGKNFTCYTAGTEESDDFRHATSAASRLGFELRSNKLDMDKLERYIPQIIEIIEDRSLGQVEVALPIYAAVTLAHEDGVRVMLTGQAADELFAGYPWYRGVADKEGYKELTGHMLDDLMKLYKETLEREDKILMAHSIELRVPYLDPELVMVSTGIATELKLPPGDSVGKHVHREVAIQMGIPEDLAYRTKQAAQHGSGVHQLIENLAIARGFDEDMLKSMSYSTSRSVPEILGSSQRYGHLYSEEKIWVTPDHVQLYLDTIAYENNLTNKDDRILLESLLELS